MSTVTAVPIAPIKRGYLVWLWAGIVAAVAAAAALAAVGTGVHQTPSGLVYQVLKRGTGTTHPTDSDVALVNYVGRLSDGTVFDRSQQPTPMPVSGVVKGFSEGLKLMTKGARYRLRIPPALGYGASPPPGSPITATSTLIFDVELVDFLSEAQVRAIQQQQMMQQQLMGQMGGGEPGGAPGSAPPPR
jgi:FKBP-type peptidyl-prolyl cis-trans isomerase FkpA